MKITDVDLFYLAMPEIQPVADGTQDTFLVRLRTDVGLEGWGESDASPLVCAACYCCPPSHSNIVNLRTSLLGASFESVAELEKVGAAALRRALDIPQARHAFSAADIAMWDLLGKRRELPVYQLLDGPAARAAPKRPYASALFGDTPELTRQRAMLSREEGFSAAKFGWGPIGKEGRQADIALVAAAREGMGEDGLLLVDAGWAWGDDAATAAQRAQDFSDFGVGWLEEPLLPDAMQAYAELTATSAVPIAAGESSGRVRDAEDFILNGGIGVVQIDAGRIGGITASHAVRRIAEQRGISYVNHTFKSHLSLAAALHVFAAVDSFELLEFTVGGSDLAARLISDPLRRGSDGTVVPHERPGLGVEVDPEVVRQYLRPIAISVGGVGLEIGSQEV